MLKLKDGCKKNNIKDKTTYFSDFVYSPPPNKITQTSLLQSKSQNCVHLLFERRSRILMLFFRYKSNQKPLANEPFFDPGKCGPYFNILQSNMALSQYFGAAILIENIEILKKKNMFPKVPGSVHPIVMEQICE